MTPIMPAKILNMLNAQPSATNMTAEGSPIPRYSPQLEKESLFGKERDYLIALMEKAEVEMKTNIQK